ncbi:MAG: ABC transporter permease subunit, partial [Serratia proteamaculans]
MTLAQRLLPLASRLFALLAMIALVGLMPWLSGRDPALSLLRARSAEQEATSEALNAIRQRFGLDDGPLILLGRWFNRLLHGDAGNSWIS